jgi:hypothetical protein
MRRTLTDELRKPPKFMLHAESRTTTQDLQAASTYPPGGRHHAHPHGGNSGRRSRASFAAAVAPSVPGAWIAPRRRRRRQRRQDLGLGEKRGEGSGVPERRRQSSSSWRLPRAATSSPRASTSTPRAASLSFLELSRVGVEGQGRRVWGIWFRPPRWGSILAQNEKGEIGIASKYIPGQI